MWNFAEYIKKHDKLNDFRFQLFMTIDLGMSSLIIDYWTEEKVLLVKVFVFCLVKNHFLKIGGWHAEVINLGNFFTYSARFPLLIWMFKLSEARFLKWVSFTIWIWTEILDDSSFYCCVEQSVKIFDKCSKKGNFLKIINL